jgi:outer membrane protein TolC
MKPYQLLKLLTIGFLLLGYSTSQAQDLLSLEDAVRMALDKSYGIQVGKNNVEISVNNYDRGNAGFWPTVNLNAGGNLRLDNFNNQKLTTGAEFINSNVFVRNANAGIGLEWTIFDGMRMFATYDKLREMKSMSELELRTAVEQTVFDVSLAYFDIVRLQLQLQALELNMAVNQERLQLEEARAQVGKGNLLMVKQARLDKNALQAEFSRINNDISVAKVQLNRLLTRELSTSFSVADSIVLMDNPDADVLRQKALEANTELQILKKSIQINQLTLKEQEAEKYPSIVLNSNYNYAQTANSAGFSIFSNSLGINGGLSVRWALFDGGRVKRNISNTKLVIENDRLLLQDSELQVYATIQQAVMNYRNALEIAELEDENLILATESLDIVKERFRLGVANTLELKDAQTVYDQSANRRALALYEAKIAELNLRFLTGQMAMN